MVSNQDNVRKAVLFQTTTDIGEQRLKRFLSYTYRARVAHVARRGLNSALGDELNDWRHQGIAESTGDGFSRGLEHIVVLSDGYIRTVWLDPARTDNDRGLASLNGIPHFHPGQFFKKNAVHRGYRTRGLELLCQTAWRQAPATKHDKPHSEPSAVVHNASS